MLFCVVHVFHEFTKKRRVLLNVFHENVDGAHVFHADVLAVYFFMRNVEEDVPLAHLLLFSSPPLAQDGLQNGQQSICLMASVSSWCSSPAALHGLCALHRRPYFI